MTKTIGSQDINSLRWISQQLFLKAQAAFFCADVRDVDRSRSCCRCPVVPSPHAVPSFMMLQNAGPVARARRLR